MMQPFAFVFRDNKLEKIPASKLVPGDLVIVREGDWVPADAQIIQGSNLRAMEAALTGESEPVYKSIDPSALETAMADRHNMVWMGTHIVGGEGKALVTATGSSTALGEVAQSLSTIDSRENHFKRRIDKLAFQLGLFAFFAALITFIIGYFFKEIPFTDIFLFAIAVLVGVIPEGLPAVIAIVLSIGGHRMARQKAIIRTLPATEILGHTSVIATDKTGTLTQNTMTVTDIVLADGQSFQVTGNGWESNGDFLQEGATLTPESHAGLSRLLFLAGYCNSAEVQQADTQFTVLGDPTEAALWVLARKGGISVDPQRAIADKPFDKEIRYRESLVEGPEGRLRILVGAPEELIRLSKESQRGKALASLSPADETRLFAQIDQMASKGLRVIGLAYEPVPDSVATLKEASGSLIYLGAVGMKDPPRPEVTHAIAEAKQAGIRIIMQTGDHKKTAQAIAEEIGLIDPASKGTSNRQIYTEAEIAQFPAEEWERILAFGR